MSEGRYFNKALMASRPPAEAPIATTGKGFPPGAGVTIFFFADRVVVAMSDKFAGSMAEGVLKI